jgi:peroxiredoxin
MGNKRMVARFELPVPSCAALYLLMMSVLLGCTAQQAAEIPMVALAEQAVQRADPPAATPAAVEIVVETPSEVAPAQVNESPATPPVTEPQQEPLGQVAGDDEEGREYRTVFYRADARQPATVPPVALSDSHRALCRVLVDDVMPSIELEQLGGGRRRLAELAGKTATVVVIWKSDRRMALQQLVDIRRDVLEPFSEAGVAVAGIAVEESPEEVKAVLERSGADFPTLLDADGKAFAQVGSEKLPRTYLLDPQGKILWFDIEYSLSTRRELHQALRAVVDKQ